METTTEKEVMSTCTDMVHVKPVSRRSKAHKHAWIKVFLPLVREHATVLAAWQAMPVDPVSKKRAVSLQGVYGAIQRSATLRRAVETAKNLSIERAESEIYRRGIRGYVKGVYYKGIRTDEEIVYSDALALAYAKSKIVAFRDSPTSVTLNDNRVLKIDPSTAAQLSEPDLIKLLRSL